jgi:opacity protein-like surface antigen
MRGVVLAAAVMLGTVASAQAADMPDFLRGSLGSSASTVNWQGFYIGGQYGYGSSDENFNSSNTSMLNALIGNFTVAQTGIGQSNLQLGGDSARSSAYGAFTGYNWQWDDVVAGLEMSYMHGNFGGSATASEGFTTTSTLSDGLYHSVSASSSAQIAITDMATFRGRAGYSFGCFLPYVFGGAALGNADISRSVLVKDSGSTNILGPFTAFAPLSANNIMHNHMIYGYTAGLGMDINLIGGLFMRAEWEYVRFTDQVDTSVNTVRAGLGYKF